MMLDRPLFPPKPAATLSQSLQDRRDLHFMGEALRLAETNPLRVSPNPSVGCVIVRDDQIIATGVTHPPGGPHAEALALEKLEGHAVGATAYVSLEPCAHQGRTGPCSHALVKAQVSRVVYALRDPNPEVAGQGAAYLQSHGITLLEGVLADRARALYTDFLHRQEYGRPRIIGKLGMTLDAAVGKTNGNSKWITGFEARADVHRLRNRADMILTSARTMIMDNARYSVRHVPSTHLPPLAILGDCTTLLTHRPDLDRSETLLLSTGQSPRTQFAKSEQISNRSQDTACAVVDALTKQPVNCILLETGPTMLASFLAADLVDELILYVAPKIFGTSGLPGFSGLEGDPLDGTAKMRFVDCRAIGEDIKITLVSQLLTKG